MPLTQSVPMVRTLLVRPIAGQNNFDAAEEIAIHQSPDMSNCSVSAGLLIKRPGYSQFPAGASAFSSAVVGLYSTQDDENNTYFYAVTTTGVYKYDTATSAWVAITGTALTGTTLNLVWFETSQNSVVFGNGVDKTQRIDFAGGTYAVLNANCPASRAGTRFANRLYIGYTVEAGVTKPYRIRRSVASDHTNWTGVGSGFSDLDEFPYQVRNIRKIGARMAVYTEQAIHLATRTEQAGNPARFDIAAADVGLLAPYTLVGWKDEHFFLGTDDFYLFNGVQASELSLPIRDTVFGTLNPGAVRLMFGLARFDTKEYIAFLCTSSNTVPDTAWVYNKQRSVWYPWSVSGAKCGCSHRLDTTATIDSLIGTIDAQNWEFDTRDLQSQYPAMMTGHSDGKVYLWSTQYKSDNGVAIASRWTSKDFTARDVDPQLSDNKVTLKDITVSYKDIGSSFTLQFSYSVDGGATWTSNPEDIITFATAGGTTKALDKLVTHQITGNKVRFKIEQTSATETFQIISFHVSLEALDAPLYT